MFGDQQLGALADIIQTALMLRYNKRNVGLSDAVCSATVLCPNTVIHD